jgi:hypothetical protein
MSPTGTYTGWVPLDGGPDQAARRLGAPVARIAGYAATQALTRWPGGVAHERGTVPPDPLPEVWLTYPALGPAVRVVTLTPRSDLHQDDAEMLAIALCTLLAHEGLAEPWPDGTDFRSLPGRLRQNPLILGCFEFPALTLWAGANLAVRVAKLDDADFALCAPPQLIDRLALTDR